MSSVDDIYTFFTRGIGATTIRVEVRFERVPEIGIVSVDCGSIEATTHGIILGPGDLLAGLHKIADDDGPAELSTTQHGTPVPHFTNRAVLRS
jgi:hypothetical protein